VIALLVASGVVFAIALHASDLGLYRQYAKASLASPLMHSLPKEYPAASLVVFLLPLALHLPYSLGFALVAAIGAVAMVLCSHGLDDQPGWSYRMCVYLLLGAAAVVFARYDIFPALAALVAVEAARRDRWGRAWAWAVLGGLLKLFPFLLLPGFFVAERASTRKWPLRRVFAAGGVVALVGAAQSLVAPGNLFSPFTYELHRGFELSSLQGSLTLLADPLHVHWVSGFGSVEIVGVAHTVISVCVAVAMVGALLYIWHLAWRQRLSVEAVSLAVLTVGVLGDKAFAAQYLIWLVPFWAYWPFRRGWVAVAGLTTLVYPLLYGEAHTLGPDFYVPTAVALVRNALLLGATAFWLREQLRPGHQVETDGLPGNVLLPGGRDTAPEGATCTRL